MELEGLITRLKDPKIYLESLCKIKTKSKGIRPFALNEAQKDFFNALRRFHRICILKCRQLGFSTAAAGWIFHHAITFPGTNAAIISYDSEQAEYILDMMKVFLEFMPDELKPTIKYNSRHELYFPKLSSVIRVIASKDTAGRGFSLNLAHLSEVAFWEKPDDKMATILASIPEDGFVILETTPNLVGDYFHRLWTAEDDVWCRKEYGWWWGYSKEEMVRKEKEYNDPQRFAREFLMQFGATGRTVFNQEAVAAARKNVWKVGERYEVAEGVVFEPEVVDSLTVYKKPEAGGIYVIALDVAEGLGAEGDYSVAVVMDRRNGEEVAFYRGKIPPDRFGEMADRWGRYFNNALMIPEVNNHGLTTLTILKQKCYPCLYYRQSAYDKTGVPVSDRVGWRTTALTKPLMIDDFDRALREGTVTIHSQKICDELVTFVYDEKGHMNAINGCHDDCLVAASICIQGWKMVMPEMPTQIDYRRYLPSGGY